jgi:N-methylhydantoinase A/oxoprolinase/acetone carboxylase beta subunit
MDLYRFFHPHHNPRLNNVPIRYAELSELLQATTELRKALERAQHRTSKAPCDPILPEHFVDAIKASKFVEAALQAISEAHPGDSTEVLKEVVRERSNTSGWDAWTRSVQETLVERQES